MDLLRLLMPVGWAVVATAIGRFLYKYSSSNLETKWAVFTGAVLIAAVSFYGMYRVTPTWFFEREAGHRSIDESTVKRMADLCSDVGQRTTEAFSSCVGKSRNDEQCQNSLRAITRYTTQMSGIVDRFSK